MTLPYFEIPPRNLARFRAFCEEFIARTRNEPKCLYYGFSFNGTRAHCRECYADADGVLAHLENVADLNARALHLASIVRYEVHGPREELEKLRGPLALLNPEFFVVELGFNRWAELGNAPGATGSRP
jgi:quinol monooxygenase YgiN